MGTTSLPAQAVVATPNTYLAINEYALAGGTGPLEIITGANGNLWFTAAGADAVIEASPADGTVVNSYALTVGLSSCSPVGITNGPDHNIYVACNHQDRIVRIVPGTGAMTSFPIPATTPVTQAGCSSCPVFLTSGPDGLLWFTEDGSGKVSKLNVTTGTMTRYALPAGANADPQGITVGPDGNIWFTEVTLNRIGRMTTAGVLTTFAPPTANAQPFWIVPGPDGYLYYSLIGTGKIGRLSTSGVTTLVSPLTANSGLRFINVGPDGNLWFTENDANKIGSMTPTGIFSETDVPTGSSQPLAIAAGPDGNLWFTEFNGDKLGKIGPRHAALTLDKTALGFGNVPLSSTPPMNQTAVLSNQGPDTLTAFNPTLPVGGSGGVSGNFSITSHDCGGADIVSTGHCNTNFNVTSTAVPGTAAGRLDFVTESSTAYRQKLSVNLSATVTSSACSLAWFLSAPSPVYLGQFHDIEAAASCPHTALFAFRMLSPSGVWTTKQGFSASNVWTWSTAGYATGRYQIAVLVKDSESKAASYDVYTLTTITLRNPECTSLSVTLDDPSPSDPGVTVNFNAAVGGCFSGSFQWWIRNRAGVWSIVPLHDFAHSSPQFAWNTSGLAPGTYQVGVWAKDPKSIKKYDSYAYVTYTLVVLAGTSKCQAAGVSASAPSAYTGTTVTLTGSASSCNLPLFRWWVRDPAAVWHMVKDYSTDTTYPWTPTSPGTYLVGVWARQAGSTASYEAYSFVTFEVMPPTATTPCTSVNLISSAGAGSPSPGSSINFSATAAGCDGPNYRFFVATPGGAFVEKQPFSTNAVFAWDSTGLPEGNYQVAVLVRHAGASASYETAFFMNQMLSIGGATCDITWMYPTNLGTVNDITSQSPQPAGTQLTWHVVAPGCGAEFQFYVQRPGGSYAVAQPYSATATLAWNTAGLPRGTYNVKVLVRRAGKIAHENFATSTYELV
jgi:streptogramin lyase